MNYYSSIMKKYFQIISLILVSSITLSMMDYQEDIIFIEAESFVNLGGWKIDQQSMDVMGSAYVLAHGLGKPVADATTTITIPSSGKYRVWVRTRDWTAQWQVEGKPGRFQLSINDEFLENNLGTQGANWHWQDGGFIRLKKGTTKLQLHDLTGFNGRCDAIVLTKDKQFRPPNEQEALVKFRQQYLNLPKDSLIEMFYDAVYQILNPRILVRF